ncbi:MAG: hypothetical protein Q8M06_04665 [Methanobacteriaceae archaeon]|nr:hypothetical protein [Methanobacteriaceae archaeon]
MAQNLRGKDKGIWQHPVTTNILEPARHQRICAAPSVHTHAETVADAEPPKLGAILTPSAMNFQSVLPGG